MGFKPLVVQKTDNLGILDLDAVMVGANLQTGGFSDGFEFANDGNTILIIVDAAAGAGDTFTLLDKADEHGRHETTATLARTFLAADIAVIGPFPKDLWDQAGGVVRGGFSTPAVTTRLVAVRL